MVDKQGEMMWGWYGKIISEGVVRLLVMLV